VEKGRKKNAVLGYRRDLMLLTSWTIWPDHEFIIHAVGGQLILGCGKSWSPKCFQMETIIFPRPIPLSVRRYAWNCVVFNQSFINMIPAFTCRLDHSSWVWSLWSLILVQYLPLVQLWKKGHKDYISQTHLVYFSCWGFTWVTCFDPV
jgi:hypothetical protein